MHGYDAERTEAELGGAGGQRAPRTVHILSGGHRRDWGELWGLGEKSSKDSTHPGREGEGEPVLELRAGSWPGSCPVKCWHRARTCRAL